MGFHPVVVFLLISTVFVKGASFLSLPYLTILLQSELHVSPLVSGMIVGLGPLAGIFIGFYGGYLSDKIGRKGVLCVSALVCSLAFASFANSSLPWHFAILNFILGAASGVLQPSIKALIADLTNRKERQRAFYLQYFAINVGSSVGPMAGAYLLIYNARLGFLVTAFFYFVFLATFFIFVRKYKELSRKTKVAAHPTDAIPPSFWDCIHIIRKDKNFMFYLMGAIAMGLTYSQIETTLAQHLKNLHGNEGIKSFGYLAMCNSVVVVLGLYPTTFISKKVGALKAVCLGQLVMSLFYMAMGYSNGSLLFLMICMVLLTLGEILSFSNGNIVIDSLSKEGMKGSYFGATNFYLVGNTLGPAMGGFLYQEWGAHTSFVVSGLISIFGILFYLKVPEPSRS